ncbi:MAG: ATP-binding cassette domain-containing protein [Candidatus Tisiphia sp.]|nr:ATP-binding cassette domain-containing protein [Candidatus Tisiphia sp.]
MGDLKSALSIVTINQQDLDKFSASPLIVDIVNSGGVGARSDGATPINNRRATSDDVTNFSSIDYKAIIEFKNINFGYNKELIFKDMTFSISPGEKVGIVGHSGSGKSTLINLLLRYFKVANGQILIDGQNIDNITQDSLRQNIAVIPQDTLLFHRTLMENIRYGNQEATEAEVIEASKKAHIHEFITTLPEEYNTYVGERGIKLSGGQRQRIAIARAILKDAPILILDEATSALDSQTERFIQDSLNFLIQDKRKTVLAIAHRLSTLKHMDRIIMLDKGVIIEEGTHTTLIRNKHSLYKKLWKLQEI